MALRLHADECVDGGIVSGLRRRGVDVVSAGEEGMLGASDEEHVARATVNGRVIVTADEDFLILASTLARPGGTFPGLLFILPSTTIGQAVSGIVLAAEVLEPAEMMNSIEWL